MFDRNGKPIIFFENSVPPKCMPCPSQYVGRDLAAVYDDLAQGYVRLPGSEEEAATVDPDEDIEVGRAGGDLYQPLFARSVIGNGCPTESQVNIGFATKVFFILNTLARLTIVFSNSIGAQSYVKMWRSPTEHAGALVLNHGLLLSVMVNAQFTYNEACNHYATEDWQKKLCIAGLIAIPAGFFGYGAFAGGSFMVKVISASVMYLLSLPIPLFITGTHVVEMATQNVDETMKKIVPGVGEPSVSWPVLFVCGVIVLGITVPDEIAVASSIEMLNTWGRLVVSCSLSVLETMPHLSHWRFYKESFRLFKQEQGGEDKKVFGNKARIVLAAFGHGADGLIGLGVGVVKENIVLQLWVVAAALAEMVISFPEMVFHQREHCCGAH